MSHLVIIILPGQPYILFKVVNLSKY